MTQHTTGGPVGGGQPFTLEPDEHLVPIRVVGKQGTPLGRIVAGVFLGMLAWSAFCAVVATLLLFTVLRGISDSGGSGITDTNLPAPGSGTLSQACQDAWDNGNDLTIPCAGDNPALVKELTGETS